MKRQSAFCLILLGAASGCTSDLRVLESYMVGSFSSAAQHQAAPEDYYDIQLHMVPIWTDRDDGPWLYVEQAAAARPERPYRQRVYHLRTGSEQRLESVVYALPGDPLEYAGAWKTPTTLNAFSPEELVLREGCSIMLRKDAGRFVGSTVGEGCLSSLRGASYATSEVTIEADQLMSWDRGFDAGGEQVWGATKGGYIFVKTPD